MQLHERVGRQPVAPDAVPAPRRPHPIVERNQLLEGLALSIVLVFLVIVVNLQSWLDPMIVISALLSMLNSCAANVVVVNIDAGFKGGYVAGMIARKEARNPKSEIRTVEKSEARSTKSETNPKHE